MSNGEEKSKEEKSKEEKSKEEKSKEEKKEKKLKQKRRDKFPYPSSGEPGIDTDYTVPPIDSSWFGG
jgi:hypothetical protein